MREIESICIIDDDRITMFGIRKMLQSSVKCETISTYLNGKLALEGIKKGIKEHGTIPEVIFLDINMPIMDGWQFLKEFITIPIAQKTRINIITSSIDSHDIQNWEKYRKSSSHVITYNVKPITKKKIVEITRTATTSA